MIVKTAPKVVLSVGSRFHMFDLGRELCKRSALQCIYTGYPRMLAARFGLPIKRISAVPSHEIANRFLGAMKRTLRFPVGYDHLLSRRFDSIVAKRLKRGGNIFVGMSGQSYQSLRSAKNMGMVTIVERGSSHIRWQQQTLIEERHLSGLFGELPSEETIDSELREYESADFIAVPSSFAARTFLNYGVPSEKLLVNPYGVDLSRFTPSPLGKLSGQPPVVLHVGRCSMQKGIHYLVEACRIARADTLRLVGSIEPEAKRFTEMPWVEMRGPVAGRELPAVYQGAGIFCLLSIQEGLALVIAQAMSCGLPIIATPNTGAEELITDGESGFIVPARNASAAAEKIRLLLDRAELRQAMGEAARKAVANKFSWSNYGDRAIANYTKAISQTYAL